MNMQEDYVSFEIAKLLKEKGFSENTVCKYADVGGVTEKWYDDYRERVLRFNWEEGYLIEPPIESKDQYEIIGDTISAPTLQMAMKWLREMHNLYIDIRININNSLYSFKIYSVGISGVRAFTEYRIKSYESACEDAIKYCLENLI